MDNIKEAKKNYKREEAVLFVILDAFRWDYLLEADSPTLFSMASQGIHAKKLVSSPGFTQRSSIFTGASPISHGNYTMYIYDPLHSPFWILRPFRYLLRKLPQRGFIYKAVRKIINQIPKFTSSWAPPAEIPSNILPLISVTEDLKPIYKPGNLPKESLFDLFVESGISYKYLMAPVSGRDEEVMNLAIESMEDCYQAVFVQFSDTDGLVHRFGSESEKRREIVHQADERVRKLKEVWEKKSISPWIVVIGDHGMADVEDYIDIQKMVEKFASTYHWINGKEFLMFLDSTLARFWFLDQKVQKILEPFLRDNLQSRGRFLDKSYMENNKIPSNSKKYGDLIWRANIGEGIFPDFFHSPSNQYKAMHGYDCLEDKMKGTAIIFNKNLNQHEIIEEARIQDITSTICDILSLRHPTSSEGKSLIKKTINER